MIRNSDIIERMECNGNYGEADEFRNTLREHGHSEYEYADRYNPADGAQHTYAGDKAEQAYEDIRRQERREEERREEEYRLEQERYYQSQQQIEEY